MAASTGLRSAISRATAARRSSGRSWTSPRSSGPTAQARPHPLTRPLRSITQPSRASVPGKSNCMDAVSFCTGVNSKDLRGKKLKDLIYRSTKDDGTGALLSQASRNPR